MGRLNLNIKNGIVAVDTETTGLNPWRPKSRWGIAPDRPFAVSFSDSEYNSAYVRFEVSKKDRSVSYEHKQLRQVRDILADPSISKIFHNVSFDHRMLEMAGIPIKGDLHDTIFMTHVYTGGGERSYGLKQLGQTYLDIPIDDQEALKKSVHAARREGKKKGWAIAKEETHGREPVYADFWLGDPDLCEEYAERDAIRTMMLYDVIGERLRQEPELHRVYRRELNLFWVVKRMEEVGCRVFPQDVSRLKKFYQEYMEEQMKQVDRHGGRGLNFNSSQQMQKKFYEELGFEQKFHRKTGNPSLDGKHLAQIAKKNKLARAILEWKAGEQMLSGFLNPYDRFMVKESKDTWVLHPKFKQCGPITGRMSCSDPNLMNVASEETGDRKTEIALKPRECLGPRDGHVWYMPDWSQIEVWIFAFAAQDPTMMEALLSGKDFHDTNAKKAWGYLPDYEEKKKIYRKRAKGLFFGRLYGGGVKTASETLECSREEAANFIFEFEQALPGVKKFIEETSSEVIKNNGISNVFGRRYAIPKDFAYKGVNYLVQGTAADVAKRAMIRIHRILEREKAGNLILMLHDEFAIEVPRHKHGKDLMRKIVEAMQEDSERLGIPIKVPVDMEVVQSRWSSSVELCRKHFEPGCCKLDATAVQPKKKIFLRTGVGSNPPIPHD